jgi:hypothetical protein
MFYKRVDVRKRILAGLKGDSPAGRDIFIRLPKGFDQSLGSSGSETASLRLRMNAFSCALR